MNRLLPILLSVILTVAAQVALKLGASSLLEPTGGRRWTVGLRALRVPGVLVGLALYAASAGVWLYVLATTPLSYAYPFLGLTYVGVAVASMVVLRERFSTVQWIGLLLVLTGVVTVALSA